VPSANAVEEHEESTAVRRKVVMCMARGCHMKIRRQEVITSMSSKRFFFVVITMLTSLAKQMYDVIDKSSKLNTYVNDTIPKQFHKYLASKK
jgi:hypothetical protein